MPLDRDAPASSSPRARSARSCTPSASARTGCATRPAPPWFFERARYGGILTDIASHQVEQFLFFTGDREAERRLRHGRQPRQPGRRRACRTSATCTSRTDRRHRHDPRRLVHAGRPADLGRRPADHRRHRGHDRAAQVRRHRRRARAATICSSSTATGVRHIDCAGTDLPYRPPVPRRRPRPHRDRDAAGALLHGDGDRAEGADARRGDAASGGSRDHRPGSGTSASSASTSAARTSSRATRRTRRFRVATLCDLDEARLASVGDEFGIARPHHVLRRSARRSGDRHRRHLHAAAAAPPAGRGRARRRQARRLREAADRLARRLRRHHRRREGREGPADADLPVPLRRRRREGEAHHRRRASPASSTPAASRPSGSARPTTTPCPGAANGRPSSAACSSPTRCTCTTWRCLLAGPAARVFGRVATRVNAIEVEDCVSASLLLENGALALAHLHPRLAGRDQPPAPALRERHLRVEPRRLLPGQRPVADPRGAATRCRPRIDALLADWQPVGPRFTTQMAHFADALDGGAPLPVTSADARRALELVTAIYQSSDTGADVALPIGAGQPEIRRLAGADPLRGETPMATSVVLDKVVKRYGDRAGDPRHRPRRSTRASSRSSSALPAAASRRCCG